MLMQTNPPCRRTCAGAVLLATCMTIFLSGNSQVRSEDPFVEAPQRLVETRIRPAGVSDQRVLTAIGQTLRHEFVPRRLWGRAYLDMALPIGDSQTISSPFIVALMTETLNPQPTDRVLEVGTGSGYQAAVLSPLVDHVYTVEIVESLGTQADGRSSGSITTTFRSGSAMVSSAGPR